MSSTTVSNQPRGAECRRLSDQLSFDENLLERILSRENLYEAFRRVKSNKGAPGVDGITVQEFREWVDPLWSGIFQSLRDGTYKPSPVLRCEIPKDNGKMRLLGIPTVLDRTIQQAISQIINPSFDEYFSNSSYGFRPFRNCHQAVRQVRSYIEDGYRIAVDVDLERYFDTVNHDLLMERLGRRIRDKRVLKLIKSFLLSGVEIRTKIPAKQGRGGYKAKIIKQIQPSLEGVPQGGPLSPLLANIMLDDFDKELEKRGHKFARYADDFIIVVKSKRAGERVLANVTKLLKKTFKLTVNEAKSQVVPTNLCSFLGFTFKGKKIRWTEKSYGKFIQRLKELTSRTWGVSMEYRFEKLAEYIRGWMGYYRLSEYYLPIDGIDSWLRRRIRMCYLKMWGRMKTIVRKLLALGVSVPEAVGLGRSRKKWWGRSKNPVINKALSDKYLANQGLISIKDLWVQFHYPK
jgi:RNA-directed DNA polymerase